MSSAWTAAALAQLTNLPSSAQPVIPTSGKRTIRTGDDMIGAVMDPVMSKRLRTANDLVGPLRAALPGVMAGSVNAVDTGFSTEDAHTDDQITKSILMRPFPEGWHRGFSEKMMLFCNRKEPIFAYDGTHTCANVPVLNYLFEQQSILDAQTIALRQDLLPDASDLTRRHRDFMCRSEEEFFDKWSPLGVFNTRQPGGYKSSSRARQASTLESQVGFNMYGRAYTFNLFAPRVRRGDKLYFVVREFPATAGEFVDPSGQVITGRVNYPRRFLQIRGFSSAQMDTVPVYPSNETDMSLEFMAKHMRVNQENVEYEWDDELDAPRRVRDNADEPDADAEMMRNVSQLVYQAYEISRPIRMGIARDTIGRDPTLGQIAASLRDQEQMKKLQQVHFYMGI